MKEYFQLFFNENFDAAFIIMLQGGKVIACNDTALHLFGFESKEEVIGTEWRNLGITELPEELYAIAKEDISRHRKWIHTFACKPKNSTHELKVKVSLSMFLYEAEEYCFVRAEDLTEVIEQKQKLAEKERRVSTLLNNLPGMAYRCKPDSSRTMEFVSSKSQKVIGYKPEEIIYNSEVSFFDLIHPDFKGHIHQELIDKITTQQSYEYEYKIVTKDGSEKWISEQGECIYDKKGELIALEGFITDITTRKESERKLHESEKNYKQLVDNSPFGIIIHNEGKVHYVNNRVLEILDEENEQELSRNLFHYLKKSYHQKTLERTAKVLQDGEIPFTEMKLSRRGGKDPIDIEVKSNKTIFKGKEMIQTAIRDITSVKDFEKQRLRAELAEEINMTLEREIVKRCQTEEELKQTQELNNSIINSALDMILTSDNDGKIVTVSPSAEEIFGYTAEEIMHKGIDVLYASKEQLAIVEKELLETGKFQGEVKNVSKDGTEFTCYLSASILKDSKGNQIGTMGVSRDISDLKEARQKLRKQTSKLEAIIEGSSNLMIYTLNENLQITSMNKRMEQFLKERFEVDVELGNNIIDLLRPYVREEHLPRLRNSFLIAFKGKYQQFEGFMEFEGKERKTWMQTFVNPVRSDSYVISEVSCLTYEITDTKESEGRLRESLREKEVLLKEVHHRVKNNLQVISSILNLQSSYVKDNNTLNILRESQNRIKSMSFIHESLYQNTNFSSIKFPEYIENLSRNLVQTYAFDRNIEILFELDAVEVSLDQAIPCGLILNELISNALKYAFIGKNSGQIRIHLSEENQKVLITVQDNGIGMPIDYDIEEADSLGLQLVYTLIEQLDGEIQVTVEKGTKYLITFVKQPKP